MAFPKNLLTEHEEVIMERNPHWIFMASSIAMIVLSLLVFIVLAIVLPGFVWLGLIAIVFVLIGALGQFLRWQTTQFVVTSERIVTRQGILSKEGIEIPLDRVTNIHYKQSLLERILGAGDLLIESAGETGQEPFSNIANPAQVQTCIYRQSELFQERRAQAGPASSAGSGSATGQSVPDQLEKLAELRDRGILSDDEFNDQKRNLLERM